MAEPTFKHCLICEDVRPERHGLATILGFYGVTPDVTIFVKDFDKPLRQLTFSLIGGTGRLRGSMSLELTDEHGSEIFKTPEQPLDIDVPEGREGNLVVGGGFIRFLHPGKHTLTVKLNGKAIYTTSFKALRGGPELFGTE